MTPDEIYKLRNEKGLSQRELAILMSKSLQVEVSHTAISKWENAKSRPNPAYLRALNEILVYQEDCGTYTDIIRKQLGIDDSRNISGSWYTEWSYKENEKTIINPNSLEITHNGDIIRGKSKTKKFEYEIIGHLLNDSIISGIWFSILKDSQHHGVFMIHLSRNGKKGTGNWIGTYDNNKDNFFMCGDWIWDKK